MNQQMKYVMQGVTLAVLFIFTLNTVKYFKNNNLQRVTTEAIAIKKPDTIFRITNFKGQALFNEKCTACHSYFKRDGMQAIAGFEKRTPDKKLLYEWIRNSSKVVESGNPYYNGLYKEYGVLMTSFPELTDQQISDILDYMKQAERVQEH